MRRLALFLCLSLFSVSACAPLQPQKGMMEYAVQGNREAQLALGDFYCMKAGDGAEAARWWEKAAVGINDPDNERYAVDAMEQLGKHHLALYVAEEFYNPETTEPYAYCAGDKAAKTNYAEAEKWLKECAQCRCAFDFACEVGLGHLNYKRQDYAQAYFWYAVVLAGVMMDAYIGAPDRPVLSLDDPKLIDTYGKKTGKDSVHYVSDMENARRAAAHLTEEQVKELNLSADAWMRKYTAIYQDRIEKAAEGAREDPR